MLRNVYVGPFINYIYNINSLVQPVHTCDAKNSLVVEPCCRLYLLSEALLKSDFLPAPWPSLLKIAYSMPRLENWNDFV